MLSMRKFFQKKPIKLAMTYLVKNEVDIIKENIKVHSALGVDCFVVIDNGSTDGTLELLYSLKNDYEIIVISRPIMDYQQSNWRTEMAKIAKSKFNADWVISNDADEFWIPKNGKSLKSELTRTGSILDCPRYDVQLDKNSLDQPFYERVYRQKYPIDYGKIAVLNDDHISVQLSKINGKVIVNLNGLLRIKGGNHRAWHLWGWLNKKKSDDIDVYHYSIGTYKHFIGHIKNREKLLDNNVTKMGNHYRRWVSMLQQGTIDKEWDRLVLDEDAIKVLSKYGVIIKDEYAKKIIKSIINI